MNWIRQIVERRSLERDLADEIQGHLAETVDTLVAQGMSREEALATARRTFGNVTLIEERGRDVWRWRLIEDAWADIRYAVRQLRHTPSFTAAAVSDPRARDRRERSSLQRGELGRASTAAVPPCRPARRRGVARRQAQHP